MPYLMAKKNTSAMDTARIAEIEGAPFSLKYKWKRLPMSYNVYMQG